MIERRMVRVLVPYSRTLYYTDKGRERGITADAVREFEQYLNRKYKTTTSLNSTCRAVFEQYEFPGNIRELRNALERAVLMSGGQGAAPWTMKRSEDRS